MKDYVVVENNHKRNKILSIILLIASILIFFMGIWLIVTLVEYDLNDVKTATGVVADVQIDEKNDSNYVITMENGDQYTITGVITTHLPFDTVESIEGQTATLYYFDLTVIGIESNETILDKQDGFTFFCNNYITGIIFSFILVAILAGISFLYYYLSRKRKFKKVDIFQHYNSYSTELSPVYKKFLGSFFVALLIWFLLLIPLIVFGTIDDTSIAFYVFLGIWIAASVLVCIIPMILLPVIRKKSIPYFVNLFNYDNRFVPESDTKKYAYDCYNSLTFKFNESFLDYDEKYDYEILNELYKAQFGEDLDIENELQTNEIIIENNSTNNENIQMPEHLKFDYENLNLYTRAIFRPTMEHLTICIVSDISEENSQGLEHNLMFILDKDLYFWIEKYNVHVAGLEYCLNNREKLMNEYCKGKVKYITFNDDGIKEITSPKIFYKDKKED